ncbi:MAG: 3-hydroxybutyryl-CoA dehydrogenase [Gammaproteobacteria bacterium]|jgi:3-hydroxybutyryl-CoA dehydrogenase
MPKSASSDNYVLGVLGAGAMGRGIVQVAAAGGLHVRLYDTRAEAVDEAIAFVRGMFARAAEKERMSPEEAAAAGARIEAVSSMQELAVCDAVIEAVVENLEVKKKVFAELESIVSDDTILATNTSSLSVTTIAADCTRPNRVAGLHFFNPVPLMPLVEVIAGVLTDEWVCDTLMAIGRRMTREPVRVNDAPGFLVNQVGRGFNIEAAHMVQEGISDTVSIDRIMRDGAGFRMGPFQLMDLTGLDVTHPATVLIYEQSFHEPRFRPAMMMEARTRAGRLGRKVGRGFYSYEGGQAENIEEAAAPAYDGRAIWVSAVEPEGHDAVIALLRQVGAKIDQGDAPAANSLIVVTPIGDDATTSAVDQGLDASRTVAVDTVMGFSTRRTVMTTPITQSDYRDCAHAVMCADGVPATVISDGPGFVAQRIVAMICNVGCSVAQMGVASPQDIDKAVTLGLNYPYGPLAFGDRIGAARILRILDGIYGLYRDPRYRPSPWLTRRAKLGISLLTPDARDSRN